MQTKKSCFDVSLPNFDYAGPGLIANLPAKPKPKYKAQLKERKKKKLGSTKA